MHAYVVEHLRVVVVAWGRVKETKVEGGGVAREPIPTNTITVLDFLVMRGGEG